MSTKKKKSLSARFSKIFHRSEHQQQQHGNQSVSEDDSGLCHLCSIIGFGSGEDDRGGVVRLGNLGDIEQRSASCLFCKLVMDSMRDERVSLTHPIDHFYTHMIRLFRRGPDRFGLSPLPLHSSILLESEAEGFDRVASASQVDFGMVKGWLETCDGGHDKCVPNEGPFGDVDLSFFRCIDVVDMCIAPVSFTSKYVALSYTWGDCEPFLLLTQNKDDLFAKDGLRKYWAAIPKTIQDSIEVVRKVGCRYVWIDQLCLIQDNDDDRGKGINTMDLVYEQAYFTIIAGSGTDANSGLPGVRDGTRSALGQVMSEIQPGVKLVLRHALQDLLMRSEYHHRGWTFQEYYLSRRKIIFIDNTLYFSCHEQSHQELKDGLTARSDPIRTQGQALHRLSGDVYHLLGQLLNEYTTRQLRMPNDYVYAMAGICRRLANYAQCDLLYGIPVSALDWFILFYPNMNGLRRRNIFPSWAWSGWYGQIYYNWGSGNLTKWLEASTWIIWYKREASGEVAMVRNQAEDRMLRANELFGYLCNVSRAEPSRGLVREQYTYTMLQFWTISARFGLRKIDQEEGEKMMWSYALYWTPTTYELLDRDAATCGFITLDDPASDGHTNETSEFILLSLSVEKSKPTDHITNAGGRLFWVMMIEWNEGVAERKGIGKIQRSGVASALDPGVSWKEVVLA